MSWKTYKYKKDLFLVIAVILIGLLAVSADGFSDLADKKFWWNFWSILHIVSIVTFVGGWIYLKAKDNRK